MPRKGKRKPQRRINTKPSSQEYREGYDQINWGKSLEDKRAEFHEAAQAIKGLYDSLEGRMQSRILEQPDILISALRQDRAARQ